MWKFDMTLQQVLNDDVEFTKQFFDNGWIVAPSVSIDNKEVEKYSTLALYWDKSFPTKYKLDDGYFNWLKFDNYDEKIPLHQKYEIGIFFKRSKESSNFRLIFFRDLRRDNYNFNLYTEIDFDIVKNLILNVHNKIMKSDEYPTNKFLFEGDDIPLNPY